MCYYTRENHHWDAGKNDSYLNLGEPKFTPTPQLEKILMGKYVTGTEDELNKQMICGQKIVLYGPCIWCNLLKQIRMPNGKLDDLVRLSSI